MGCLATLLEGMFLSYQVIARKWRPQAFQDLVGQPHIRQTLLNALKSDRLPHALLLTGPRGTGKTSTARILAKALRCPHAVDFVPCHECGECKDIAAGSSLSVIEIDGASNNGVEDVRELRNSVHLMPSTGQYKIYIIDEVHMLSTSAFNALLKTLEEPPEHVIFVMATTEVQKIPNTILSRCQRFDFRRIPVRLVAETLESICAAENIQAEKEALWVIARQGEGSMRDSQSLLDQVITFCQGPITLAQVTEALGLTDRQLLMDSLLALVRRDQKAALEIIERLFQSGYDSKIYLQDLLEELRHLLLIQITPAEKLTQLVDLPDSEIEHLKSLGAELSQEDVHLLFDMTLKGASDLARAQDPKILLEMLLLRMASAPRLHQLKNLWAATATVPATGGPAPQAARTPMPTQQSAAPKTSETPKTAEPPRASTKAAETPRASTALPTPLKATAVAAGARPQPTPPENPGPQDWMALVQQIKGVNPLLGASLEHTCLLQAEGRNLTLGITEKKKFLVDQMLSSDFQKKLAQQLKNFWGEGFQVQVEPLSQESAQASSSSLTPKALGEKIKEVERQALLQQVQDHPLVKKTQSLFKAEIRSIKEIKT